MIQQVSDSELELMKIIWENGGMALYADIMEKLAQTGRTWQKNTCLLYTSGSHIGMSKQFAYCFHVKSM